MLRVNDTYSFIKGKEDPLSSDVAIISSNNYNYIFEVGSSVEIANELYSIDNKVIIISHFHQDHLSNINK